MGQGIGIVIGVILLINKAKKNAPMKFIGAAHEAVANMGMILR